MNAIRSQCRLSSNSEKFRIEVVVLDRDKFESKKQNQVENSVPFKRKKSANLRNYVRRIRS